MACRVYSATMPAVLRAVSALPQSLTVGALLPVGLLLVADLPQALTLSVEGFEP